MMAIRDARGAMRPDRVTVARLLLVTALALVVLYILLLLPILF